MSIIYSLIVIVFSISVSYAQVGAGTNVVTNRDANGWTIWTPQTGSGSCTSPSLGHGSYTGSCIIYVSASGNDSNTCIAPPPVDPNFATPCLTVTKGLGYVRDLSSDWLLFKKGDTWTDQPIGFPVVQGKSLANPILIGSYGSSTSRPLFNVSTTGGGAILQCQAVPTWCNNFVLTGLEFYSYKTDPNSGAYDPAVHSIEGMSILNPANMWIEDVKWSYYLGLDIQNNSTPDEGKVYIPNQVVMRRTIVANNYDSDLSGGINRAQGMFTIRVTNFVFDENVFHHNGWNATVGEAPSTQAHNLYVGHDTLSPSVNITKNWSSYPSANCFQGPRPGGYVYNNLVARCPIAGFVAAQPNSTIDSNVAVEAVDVPTNPNGGGGARGDGWEVQDGADNSTMSNNLLTQSAVAHSDYGLFVLTGINNAIVINNVVCNWPGTNQFLNQGTNTTAPIVPAANGNYFFAADCTHNSYPDSTRSLERYDSEVLGGPGTLDDLVNRELAQSKDNWDPRLRPCVINDWMRAGFNMVQRGCN